MTCARYIQEGLAKKSEDVTVEIIKKQGRAKVKPYKKKRLLCHLEKT